MTNEEWAGVLGTLKRIDASFGDEARELSDRIQALYASGDLDGARALLCEVGSPERHVAFWRSASREGYRTYPYIKFVHETIGEKIRDACHQIVISSQGANHT